MAALFEYDRSYEPAAPVVEIGLSRSGATQPAQTIRAMIDSGADATILPVEVLKSSGARFVEHMRMRGIVGEAINVRLYLLAVHVAGGTVHGVRAIGTNQTSEAVIGRDVLNQLRIILDGPALSVMIE